MIEYLLMAISFYMGAATVNLHTFKNASPVSIFLGIFGALIFPITCILLIYEFSYSPFKK